MTMPYIYLATLHRIVSESTISLNVDLGMGFINRQVYFTIARINVKPGARLVMEGLMLNRPLSIRTFKNTQSTRYKYRVDIYLTINNQSVCLNDLLVRKGLADYIKEYNHGRYRQL